MSAVSNLILFIIMIVSISVMALLRELTKTTSIRSIMRKSNTSSCDLFEFLTKSPGESEAMKYFRFNEETVRSHTYRYVGRFDSAIFHWEDVPCADLVIERKFPTTYLPEKSKREDIFQCGLYTLALEETGVSCRDTKLVTIYCLQDVAKRCLDGNSARNCWDCREGKIFSERYDKRKIEKHLKRINEVWYKKRRPRANPSITNCRPCPYSKNGKCNYSSV